ncbi:MAG: hypothetical protein ACOC5T_08555 [Elusimicrobiota bacterium]
MSKMLREDRPIEIAPKITGQLNQGRPLVFDEKSGEYLNPSNVDDKIKIYERQVKEWFLNRATRLLRGENNGFIVLMICLSYLEGVQQYREGTYSNWQSKQFFVDAIERLYPGEYSHDDLKDFYKQARCGLFHDGMTRSKVIYNYGFDSPLRFAGDLTIEVNPKMLLEDIKSDFNGYIEELKRSNNLRNIFDRMFGIL